MTKGTGTVSKTPKIKRRQFLAGAAAAGPLIGLSAVNKAAAQNAPAASAVPAKPQTAGDTQAPSDLPRYTTNGKPGGDFMVDCLKALDIDYVASCPGSTFRALQESIINYGMNKKPEFITCLHEEASVAMAHGYAKIAGKPMASMVHGVVGTQHASMAIYNCFADQAPALIMAGNVGQGTQRRPGVEWAHSAHDQAVIVRDYVKWDDQAANLQDFAEGVVRAYDLATTAPMGPVFVVVDADQQEEEIEEGRKLFIPKPRRRSQPVGDSGAVAEAAKLLVGAENPVIVAGRVQRTDAGPKLLALLAETLQAPVVDERSRMNMANRHPLNHTERGAAAIRQADVILALEPMDLYGTLNNVSDIIGRPSTPKTRPGVKVIVLGTTDVQIKPNFGEYARYTSADLAITGDAEATLPSLIHEIEKEMSPARKSVASTRGQKLKEMAGGFLKAVHEQAALAWTASPISTARTCAEVWDQLKNDEYTMSSEANFLSEWPYRLWNMDKHYNSMGRSVGGGVGYTAPASLGAALANKEHGRITVSLNGDGDLLMSPGVLWSAAHHQIPILYVVHNNRAYHQEYMHVQRIAQRNQRGVDRAHIGTTIDNPNIDFATLAKSFGVYSEGPISNPVDLGPAITRALAVVRKGEPALIDVVSQPR
jgi:thiamine pyrophosphate-dependent acetolactate synthase large subunit-like protein